MGDWATWLGKLFLELYHNIKGNRSWYLQPLVNAARMKFVLARKCAEQLSGLEVTQTHDARRLKRH